MTVATSDPLSFSYLITSLISIKNKDFLFKTLLASQHKNSLRYPSGQKITFSEHIRVREAELLLAWPLQQKRGFHQSKPCEGLI